MNTTSANHILMDETELRQVAWIGDAFVRGEITGIVVNFHGLGFGGVKGGPGYEEQEWADSGALVVFPYYGPWSWMNRSARAFVDRLIASVYHHFKLTSDIPLIIAGSSMGGLSALIYTRYSPHRITACLALFPVCDLEYSFTERPDVPPTIRHAFRDYPGDLTAAMIENSPLQQAAQMPDIPYLLIHGDKDLSVNKAKHSDRFVAAMHKHKKNVRYLEVPGMTHGGNVTYQASRAQIEFVKGFLVKRAK